MLLEATVNEEVMRTEWSAVECPETSYSTLLLLLLLMMMMMTVMMGDGDGQLGMMVTVVARLRRKSAKVKCRNCTTLRDVKCHRQQEAQLLQRKRATLTVI